MPSDAFDMSVLSTQLATKVSRNWDVNYANQLNRLQVNSFKEENP